MRLKTYEQLYLAITWTIAIAMLFLLLGRCGGGDGESAKDAVSAVVKPIPPGYILPPGAILPPGYEPPPGYTPPPEEIPPGQGYTPPPGIIVPVSAVHAAVNNARGVGRTCGTVPYPAAPPLPWSIALRDAAYAHALDMLVNNYISQDNNEAIFVTSTSNFPFAEDVVEAMIGAPTNCKVLMNPTRTAVGAAYADVNGARSWTFRFE